MKKILLSITLTLMLVFIIGCSKNDYTSNVSQLRQDLLQGENELFEVILSPEQREINFEHDGNCTKTQNLLVFKITPKTKSITSLEIKFNLDKDYCLTASNLSQGAPQILKVNVESLNFSQLEIELSFDQESCKINLISKKNADTASFDKALNFLAKEKFELFESLSSDGYLCAEIHVRLLCEKNANFWYIGIVTNEQTYAFLIDAKATKIIAEKTLKKAF